MGLVKQQTQNKKKQDGGFLDMSLGTIGASMLGNMLIGNGVMRAGKYNNIGYKIKYKI